MRGGTLRRRNPGVKSAVGECGKHVKCPVVGASEVSGLGSWFWMGFHAAGPMELYPGRALERAMKVQEVILRAIGGQISWMQAAEILGYSDRTMRRWRVRYEHRGYDGLFDRRLKRPSPRRALKGGDGGSAPVPGALL